MPRIFIHIAFLFITTTALSGVWMRYFPFDPNTIIPYTNVLHGHSHLAILGWAFLGVFIVFVHLNWKNIQRKKQAIAILSTLSIISFVMFIAFAYQGYGVFSIVMSTLHIFAEYWAAIFIYRELKTLKHLPKSGTLFIKGSLIALIISSIGPYALAYTSANGLKEHAIFDMSVYFYLHFQYNGWLYLFLIGLLIMVLHLKKITFPSSLVKLGFWVYILALFPGYLSNVLWADLGMYSNILAIIGVIGQWVGVLCILFACKSIWKDLKGKYTKLITTSLWLTFALLFVKSTMELGLIFPQLTDLIYDSRSIVIGYLHLTLLGFVSIFIIALFQMVKIIESNRISILGFTIFMIGFLVNELTLFVQGLFEWLQLSPVPYYSHILLIASFVLFIGVMMIWFSLGKRRLS